MGAVGFACCLNRENIGRLFCTAGGELRGGGDDGGLDRNGPSEESADALFGLDVGGADLLPKGDEMEEAIASMVAANELDSDSSTVSSTRLRFVGGSSS